MQGRAAADERLIQNLYIAGEQNIVGNDHIVSDIAIVTDVHADHEKIFITNCCCAVLPSCRDGWCSIRESHCHCRFRPGFASFRKTHILRRATDNRAMPDSIVSPDHNLTFDDDVRADARVLPNRDLIPDYCVRDRSQRWRQSSHRVNDRSRVNHSEHACFLEAEVRRATFSRRADDDVIKQFDLQQFSRFASRRVRL